jgi:mono/diheme cytochrome c family protein
MRASLLLIIPLLAGCTKSNMDSQPKYHEYEPAGLFRDGKVLQTPPVGTMAREDDAREATNRPALTDALLSRGRERFDIYCSPCHDRAGNGNGIIVQRGMPRPSSFHSQALRAADDQHFYDVTSNGYGAMYAFADRVRPRDRWAIVAYIRALQLSQHAALSDVSESERAQLSAEPRP